MKKEELDLRITFLISKIRNICYYWSIDDRKYKVYMHVIKTSRNQSKELLPYLMDNDPRKKILVSILKTIPSKLKSKDCKTVIENLSKIIYVK